MKEVVIASKGGPERKWQSHITALPLTSRISQLYPPSQKTMGLSVDECANAVCATARCRPKTEVDYLVVAETEDGHLNGTTDLSVGLHCESQHIIFDQSYRSLFLLL